jgi:uncharacterized protein YkwD
MLKYILSLCIVLGQISTSGLTAASHQSKNEATIPDKTEINKMELVIAELINLERNKRGLSSLNYSKELATCAREHSHNMAIKEVKVGHDGFEKRFKHMQKVMKLRSFGENVYYSYGIKDFLKAAVKGWMDSPGHKENILGKYTMSGVGIAFGKDGSFYATQLFGS